MRLQQSLYHLVCILFFFINIRYEKHPGRMRTGLRQRCLFFYAQRAPLNSCPEIMKKPLVKTEKF